MKRVFLIMCVFPQLAMGLAFLAPKEKLEFVKKADPEKRADFDLLVHIVQYFHDDEASWDDTAFQIYKEARKKVHTSLDDKISREKTYLDRAPWFWLKQRWQTIGDIDTLRKIKKNTTFSGCHDPYKYNLQFFNATYEEAYRSFKRTVALTVLACVCGVLALRTLVKKWFKPAISTENSVEKKMQKEKGAGKSADGSAEPADQKQTRR